MTGPEYLTALERISLDKSDAGNFFGAHRVTGYTWTASGPPEPVAMLLRAAIRLGWSLEYLSKVSKESADSNWSPP